MGAAKWADALVQKSNLEKTLSHPQWDNIRHGILLLENCLDFLPCIPDNAIPMVLTSPPYDKLRDYEDAPPWNFDIFQQVARELYRVLTPGGVIVWIVGDSTVNGGRTLTSFRQALYFQELGLRMYDCMIYQKTGSGPPHPNRYFNSYEYMFVLSKGKPQTVNLLADKPNKWAGSSTWGEVSRREKDGSLTPKGAKIIAETGIRTNIWTYKNGYGQGTKAKIAYRHPAIFPEQLAADHIRSWSNPGDIVLDPFAGSGTTGIVAEQLQRYWIMIEAVPKYCDIILDRLSDTQA